MSRLSPLDIAQFTARQHEVHDQIASGPRGGVRGPLAVWLNSPDLAEKVHPLGEHLRFSSSLSGRLAELVVLLVARHWRAGYEWYAHEPLARKFGIADHTINAIAARRRPDFKLDDEKAVWGVATELLANQMVSSETYEYAKSVLGEAALVDLSVLIGYYGLVACTLNLFEVSPPKETQLPW